MYMGADCPAQEEKASLGRPFFIQLSFHVTHEKADSVPPTVPIVPEG
jgi:hypothetical protein